jgi:hypothetical protein
VAHRTVRFVLGYVPRDYMTETVVICVTCIATILATRAFPRYGVGDGLGTPPGTGSVMTGFDGVYGGGVTGA